MDGSGVYGQKYTSDGSRDGDEFLINTQTDHDQEDNPLSQLGGCQFHLFLQ